MISRKEDTTMRRRVWIALLAIGVMVSLSACGSWAPYLAEERQNGAHFATWQHMGYSLFRATPKDTTRRDIASAQQERWWGDPILVEPIQ
jgi:hypothetical protein